MTSLLLPPTASRLPQSRRLRPATISGSKRPWTPPQDCRSRGDCGKVADMNIDLDQFRLKIAAVAATAARQRFGQLREANDRLKIAAVAATAACGQIIPKVIPRNPRLKIAAVAATAAGHALLAICELLFRLKIAAVAATAATQWYWT